MLNEFIIKDNRSLEENFESINKIPGLITVKDITLKFAAITKEFAMILGWKNNEEGLGQKDFNIPCKASRIAERFVEIDQKVINEAKTFTTLDICETSKGVKVCLTKKIPIVDHNNFVSGIYGNTIDISKTSVYQWYLLFNKNSLSYNTEYSKSQIYILDTENCPLKISSQHQICMFLLVRGKSLKEIANILKLSPRTIESYFEKIKLKLDCNSKSSLIDLAISSGFINFIPKKIIQNSYPFFT